MAPRVLARKGGRFALVVCSLACLSLAVAATPYAASGAKVPACAKGQRSTAKKPCKAAKKAVAAPKKLVALPICNAGQRSTTARPCITLTDNGPPPTSSSSSSSSSSGGSSSSSSSSSSSTKTTTTTTPTAAATPLVGPHINSHLCQSANGTVFECQNIQDWDPANPTPGNYPQIGN